MTPSNRLVSLMRARAGKVVSPADITLAVYGYALRDDYDRSQVRVVMHRARARLSERERIRSVRGHGYVYEGAVT